MSVGDGNGQGTAILFSDSSSLATLAIFFFSFFTISPSSPTCSSSCKRAAEGGVRERRVGGRGDGDQARGGRRLGV